MLDDSNGPRPVLDSSESPVMKRKGRKRRAIVDSDSEGEGVTVESGRGGGVEEGEEGKRENPKEEESSDEGDHKRMSHSQIGVSFPYLGWE